MSPLARYTLFQIPGIVIVLGGVYLLRVWAGLSDAWAAVFIGLWFLKDIVAYPIVKSAYQTEVRTGDLARALGLAPGALAAALLPLELDGAVVDDRDGRLRVVRESRVRGPSSAP